MGVAADESPSIDVVSVSVPAGGSVCVLGSTEDVDAVVDVVLVLVVVEVVIGVALIVNTAVVVVVGSGVVVRVVDGTV